jgi:hypothetical protein
MILAANYIAGIPAPGLEPRETPELMAGNPNLADSESIFKGPMKIA